MSQIISIYIGSSSTKIGLQFWQQLNHKVQQNLQQKESERMYVQKFYHENKKGQNIPRAIFVDTDIRSKNTVLHSKQKFDEKLLVGDGKSCDNLFAQGRYGFGAMIIEQFQQKLRKEVEKCDRLSGFLVLNSPVGGAGSGLGSLVMSQIRDNHSQCLLQDIKIYPGSNHQEKYRNLTSLQVYNISLSTHWAIQCTDLILILENNAVSKILQRKGTPHSTFSDINKHYALCLNEHISSYLFPGSLNTNQRKRATNLVLFPRMKTLCGGLSEFNSKDYIEQALSPKNKLMYHEKPNDHRIFSMNVNVRDNWASQKQVYEQTQNAVQSQGSHFQQWIPTPLTISLGRPQISKRESAWILTNGRNNIDFLREVSEMFTAQFRRRAFVYHYTNLGMDEMEFTQAQSNCNDLVSEYTPCCGCDEGDFEDGSIESSSLH